MRLITFLVTWKFVCEGSERAHVVDVLRQICGLNFQKNHFWVDRTNTWIMFYAIASIFASGKLYQPAYNVVLCFWGKVSAIGRYLLFYCFEAVVRFCPLSFVVFLFLLLLLLLLLHLLLLLLLLHFPLYLHPSSLHSPLKPESWFCNHAWAQLRSLFILHFHSFLVGRKRL